jgi:hypothetical protein
MPPEETSEDNYSGLWVVHVMGGIGLFISMLLVNIVVNQYIPPLGVHIIPLILGGAVVIEALSSGILTMLTSNATCGLSDATTEWVKKIAVLEKAIDAFFDLLPRNTEEPKSIDELELQSHQSRAEHILAELRATPSPLLLLGTLERDLQSLHQIYGGSTASLEEQLRRIRLCMEELRFVYTISRAHNYDQSSRLYVAIVLGVLLTVLTRTNLYHGDSQVGIWLTGALIGGLTPLIREIRSALRRSINRD